MNERRNFRRSDKEKHYAMDKEKKHQEVMQIKRDLVNYAKTSWGKQWIHSILKIGRPYRMRRGIQYAEDEERLSNLRINKGEIFAMVQGTAPTPYRVRIKFKQIPEGGWKSIIKELSHSILNLINLLEGKLSENIIDIFEKYNYSLYPDVSEGLNASCSCPDKAIPCKHIAATILYISRVVDYKPLILLKLRGKTKKELLSELKLGKEVGPIENKESEITKEKRENDKVFSFDIPMININEFRDKAQLKDKLEDIDFQFRKPGKIIETLENLGLPPNLEHPKAFAIVIEKIYETLTKKAYELSMKSNR
ncbi:MAG: SWIM zinc finger protein [Promethearchaeota archaeon]|nr:MAG: SWIM zinc finger protein [Candidatus Lokiarchaeota archaeon]